MTDEARIYSREKDNLFKNGVGKTGKILGLKKKMNHFLIPYTKVN